MRHVREAAVAGLFYPEDARVLRATVKRLLAGAPAGGPPAKALVLPHAGYVYSGPVAATGYRLLAARRDAVRRVVLLGPAHHVAFRGIAAPRAEAFRTPLGTVPVDAEAVERAASLGGVVRSDAPHAREHAIEVHLPFLQVALASFAIAPFVVGDAHDEDVADVIDLLWGADETVVIVSSDLSHYHDRETARRLDLRTAGALRSGDRGSIHATDACGATAVRGLLLAAGRRGLAARVLDLRTSGDTAGSEEDVVGYGAFAWEAAEADPRHVMA